MKIENLANAVHTLRHLYITRFGVSENLIILLNYDDYKEVRDHIHDLYFIPEPTVHNTFDFMNVCVSWSPIIAQGTYAHGVYERVQKFN